MKTSMANVKAVLFDLDGTLLPLNFDTFLARYMKRLWKWYFNAIGVDIMAPSMAAIDVMMQNDGTRTNAEAFWTSAGSQIGHDQQTFERIYADFVTSEGTLLGEGVAADPSAPTVVEAVRSRGKRVALATNPVFPRIMIDTRARWAGLDSSRFDLVTCSHRMRFCKPSTGYYRQVAESLEVEPHECLMVGNDVAMDLLPAARIGMRTCLIESEYAVLGDHDFQPDHACTLGEVPALLAV